MLMELLKKFGTDVKLIVVMKIPRGILHKSNARIDYPRFPYQTHKDGKQKLDENHNYSIYPMLEASVHARGEYAKLAKRLPKLLAPWQNRTSWMKMLIGLSTRNRTRIRACPNQLIFITWDNHRRMNFNTNIQVSHLKIMTKYPVAVLVKIRNPQLLELFKDIY